MSKFIYGRNAVKEAMLSGSVFTIYLSSSIRDKSYEKLARSQKINIVYKTNNELDKLLKTCNHQGIAGEVDDYRFYELEEIIEFAKLKKYPLVLILDGIEDPHNMGAIIRSVDAFSVDGIIIKSKGQVDINSTVYKVSTGAIEHVKICKVNNLNTALTTLKDNGFWIVSSDGNSDKNYDEIDYKCPIGLVIGSEGFGISKLVLDNSDHIVKIPMSGHVNSLNASVATGIFLALINHMRK
ncbi:MAG: 23S rRNA (guanosine(2251)-2'-O)-methyltransferase RlmB [Bacilli bacterium]|nr:23S rRNA (guanosine(2251)-2'-O)-methyltransferase RlmB [Bacilli bacterium]